MDGRQCPGYNRSVENDEQRVGRRKMDRETQKLTFPPLHNSSCSVSSYSLQFIRSRGSLSVREVTQERTAKSHSLCLVHKSFANVTLCCTNVALVTGHWGNVQNNVEMHF